jgi:hypothetical protein
MMIHRAGDVSPELAQLVAISEALYAGRGQTGTDR